MTAPSCNDPSSAAPCHRALGAVDAVYAVLHGCMCSFQAVVYTQSMQCVKHAQKFLVCSPMMQCMEELGKRADVNRHIFYLPLQQQQDLIGDNNTLAGDNNT